jgi:hypothetical protein
MMQQNKQPAVQNVAAAAAAGSQLMLWRTLCGNDGRRIRQPCLHELS